MKIHVTDIQWDVSDNALEEDERRYLLAKLPASVDLELDPSEDVDVEDWIADQLSDKYGFCVEGYSYD